MRRLQLPKLAKLTPYLAKQCLAKISRIHENKFQLAFKQLKVLGQLLSKVNISFAGILQLQGVFHYFGLSRAFKPNIFWFMCEDLELGLR